MTGLPRKLFSGSVASGRYVRLGYPVDLFHFNEGHAVLAGVELIREKMSTGLSFDQALNTTRQQIVFTTHTPVPAGNEAHHHGALLMSVLIMASLTNR